MTDSHLPPKERPEDREGPETAAFVRGARAGDSASFGALYERLQPALLAWAHLRLRPQFHAQVSPEDLVHDVWLRARQVFPTYSVERGDFRPWLFTVAKNVLYEVQRSLHRHQIRGAGPQDSSVGAPAAEIPADVTAVTRRLARDEALQVALGRFRQLNEEERDLLIHCGLEGMTVKEAATRLGLGFAQAHKRWQRLRARLQETPPPVDLLADLAPS